MHKTTALFISSGLLAVTLLGLTSCSAPKPKATVEAKPDIVLPQKDQKSMTELKIEQLERSIKQAQASQNWPQYIELSEQLWQLADADNQLAIEYMIWHTLSGHFNNETAINQLAASRHPSLESWAHLLAALNQPGLFKLQALEDLQHFDEDALYQSHLLSALQHRLKTQQSIRQIAVLLPFKGKYQYVSSQIRNGLLKAYMVSNQSIKLKFYDSSNVEEVLEQYQLAKQQGADLVIGPLTKAAIDQLSGQNITDILALNSSDETSFKSFNFRSQSEAIQITKQLQNNNLTRIGILSSENKRDMSTAQTLMSQWLSNEENQALLRPYSLEKLNLRKELGGLINEEQSQTRYNNLRWLLGAKLEFFPRTRKDLQAIVLIGNEKQVAVFHPQFEFFQLDLPVYATSNLTPNDLQNIEPHKDLSNVIFPTIPAVFNHNALNSELEAFGWDSFILASQLSNLAPNLCLTQGQSGILYLDGQEVDKKLIWAQYSKDGLLKRWVPPVVIKTEQQLLEELMEQERLEALQNEVSTLETPNTQETEQPANSITPVQASTDLLPITQSTLVDGVQVITPN
ncbi:MAG: penicillin-binding protein activator [Pseudomonadota bacterium]|nr:penicillin-binding protein activator [Pseudomonadota bacterium]